MTRIRYHVVAILWLFIIIDCNALVPRTVRLFSSVSRTNHIPIDESFISLDIETSIKQRQACKRFKRFDGLDTSETVASISNPEIVKDAIHCLDIARLSPNAFNTQPYKIVLVHDHVQKLALSKCVLGPNKSRVRDSDCTAVFLADKKICTTFNRFTEFLISTSKPDRIPSKKFIWITKLYITIFSSGYPLPRILASPISFLVRTGVSVVNLFTRSFYLMPSLSNAETWSTKQAMLVAMAYMICCSSKGLATIPMEGINAGAIRKVLNIPSRYAVPVIISTGKSYKEIDSGMLIENSVTRRYPIEEVIYSDSFGGKLKLEPQN